MVVVVGEVDGVVEGVEEEVVVMVEVVGALEVGDDLVAEEDVVVIAVAEVEEEDGEVLTNQA